MSARATRVTTPSTVTDTLEIAARLRLSATRLARQLRQQAGSGLTPSQLSAIATIANRGPLTLGALAEHERVAPPSITRVVAKLEDDGLVTRTVDADDRRVSRVATTAAGDALLAQSRKRKNAWLAARLRELDDEQRATLHAALDILDALAEGDRP